MAFLRIEEKPLLLKRPKLNAESNPAHFSSAFHQQTIATVCDAFVNFICKHYVFSVAIFAMKEFY